MSRRLIQASTRDVDGPLLELDRRHARTSRPPRAWCAPSTACSFTLERGKALGIVGEIGSGKTVLSRSIMGLLPPRGTVRGGQHPLRGPARSATSAASRCASIWGREMSMIFQDPMTSLNPVMKIGKQIAEPLQIHLGMTRQNAWATAERLLQDVRIPEAERRLDQYPHELSGGMRQRVMIAIALACGPTLLFADEPTTALDVTVQAQILDLLGEQRRDRNMSLILVTHDLGVVAGHTDEIAVMYGGKLVEKAPTRALFANMKMPYTEALLQSIPKIDDPSHTRLQRDRRPPARPGQPAARLPLRAALPVRQRPNCIDEEPPLIEAADDPGPRLRAAGTRSAAPRTSRRKRRARQQRGRRRDRSPIAEEVV